MIVGYFEAISGFLDVCLNDSMSFVKLFFSSKRKMN